MTDIFRPCSTCKKPILRGGRFYECSVSTCTRGATHFVFCSVDCWDAHVPTMRHRDAWAEERTAPLTDQAPEPAPAHTTSRVMAASTPAPSASAPHDVLIVASKLKAYIRARSDMNTSANIMDTLSDRVRRWCDEAIEHARRDGRKTVMARDVPRGGA